MGYAVIQQPDQRLCIWSTIVDDFIVYDATPEEVVEFFVDEAKRDAEDMAKRMVAGAKERGTSGRTTMADALSKRRLQHGKKVKDDEDFAAWLKQVEGASED